MLALTIMADMAGWSSDVFSCDRPWQAAQGSFPLKSGPILLDLFIRELVRS